ncbi:NAD(P)-binding protein [Calothrix sp. UHCC 0171]|uniref:NAD(P)-binding protein n=1 Tax=Calothrix sp. UHCC 0171 TaxID=3110245 RepID=UPI002B203242|nr:NAD(P)-binding protein [Calothrix sp. UHCC 0171]MEA5570779.1 NAD(P)-binding protein [Calothrix sp. UHCC 0171]
MVQNYYPQREKYLPMKTIIIGAGITGLTCTRDCLDAGIEVEVYEKQDLESMLSGAFWELKLEKSLRDLGTLRNKRA